ncbi:MAG TPA: DUF2142 domain-containing protein, partial [Ilumatobacteraceae bacterium]|nr:DUF2142 domain-containing protein [Ilumatobacteraceae bacterium]
MRPSAGDNRSLMWLSAMCAFAIIGCTWAFAIGRYGGPDEPAHIIRAAAVAQGDLLGKPVAGFEQGYRQVTVPAPLGSGDPSCFRHDETIPASCAAITAGDSPVAVATSAGTAPPWYYAIVGVVARIFSDGRGVSAYRMVSVLLCAIVLGYAFARCRRVAGAGWLLAALTPSAWFLFGVVGTSGIEIALITLAVVEAIDRFHSPAPRTASLWRVMAPLSVCLLLRPAALIDIAVVALVLYPTVPRPLTRRCVAILTLPLAAVFVATVAWSRWTGLVVDDTRTADSDPLWSAVRRSIDGIPTTAHQAVGALGWNEFFAPPVVQLVWIAGLVFAIYWVVTQGRDRWWHVKWIVAAIVLPTVLEVVLHRRIGEIWQGRYSIPFAMAGVLYAATTVSPPRRVMRGMIAVAALAEVVTLWHTLRRYMVGLDGSLTLQHAAWQPPLNPWLLLTINT